MGSHPSSEQALHERRHVFNCLSKETEIMAEESERAIASTESPKTHPSLSYRWDVEKEAESFLTRKSLRDFNCIFSFNIIIFSYCMLKFYLLSKEILL